MTPVGPLRSVVAFVDVQAEHDLNATPLFSKRLASLGAAVAPRLSKAVTHVIFKGSPEQLRSLHERLARLSPGAPAHVLSVTWVAACAAAAARVPEAAHAQERPRDTIASLLSSPPYVRGGSGAKRRKSWAPAAADKFGAPAARAPCGVVGRRRRRAVCEDTNKQTAALTPCRSQKWTWTTRPSRPLRKWPLPQPRLRRQRAPAALEWLCRQQPLLATTSSAAGWRTAAAHHAPRRQRCPSRTHGRAGRPGGSAQLLPSSRGARRCHRCGRRRLCATRCARRPARALRRSRIRRRRGDPRFRLWCSST